MSDKPAASTRQPTEFEHQLRTHKFERDHQLGIPPCKLPTNICDQIMELYRALHPEGEKP